ncbi:hypothetical protein ABI_32820 [Asticcacaulis biprosthecium C19]|uniref:Uncharacterized protein n=1 Tax=Asticcacaulis biprosthecium C19 TaxID=715226 RepID=F4QPX9_9CAUL|nr:hypothetical protein ABI_32820 [Asticcacaulis biprosthecium C19]
MPRFWRPIHAALQHSPGGFRPMTGALRVGDSPIFILSVEKGDHNRIFDHSFVK